MIEGYFDPAGRPYVRAYVVVPGLQPAPEATALLLDTGADNTFIQPAGARILGISTQDLSPTGTSRGIGGTISYGTVPAFIAFQERPWPWRKTRLVYFQTELAVAVPDRGNGSPDGTPDQGRLLRNLPPSPTTASTGAKHHHSLGPSSAELSPYKA